MRRETVHLRGTICDALDARDAPKSVTLRRLALEGLKQAHERGWEDIHPDGPLETTPDPDEPESPTLDSQDVESNESEGDPSGKVDSERPERDPVGGEGGDSSSGRSVPGRTPTDRVEDDRDDDESTSPDREEAGDGGDRSGFFNKILR